MKTKIVTLLTLLTLLTSSLVSAQTKTPSPQPTLAQSEEIQNLKEKLASKVAELRKSDQKAISGIVQDVTTNALRLKTTDDILYEIKIDQDLTKRYIIAGNQKKEIQLKDLKKGAYLIVSGLVDNKTVTANYIYQDEQFFSGSGRITEMNSTDFYIRVLTLEKDTYTLDIENTTKRNLLNIKSLELETVGFTKIKEGDTVHFVVKKTGTEREKNRYSAVKILIIPQEFFMK